MSEAFQFEDDHTQESVNLSSAQQNLKSHFQQASPGRRGPHFRIDEPLVESPDPLQAQKVAKKEENLLKQATDIADHLRGQFHEITRRENNLNEQLTLLDKERRNMRLWVSQIEADFTERDELLKKREQELNEKVKSCNLLIRKIESGDIAGASVVGEQTISNQSPIDLPDLDRFMNLENENSRLRQQLHQLDESHQAEIRELRDELEQEQEALVAEYEQLKKKHLSEKKQWVDEYGDLEEERQLYTKAIERSQSELDELLDEQTDQLKQQQEFLRSATEDFAVERERLTSELEEALQERDSLREDLIRKESELQSAIEEQSNQPVDGISLAEFEEEKKQFQQREAVFENRMRFQEAHLAKAREELQQMQNELKQEKQKATQYFEEKNRLLQMQKAQLNKFRESIDTREESLKRSEETLKNEYHTLKSDVALEKQQLENMKTRWNQQREMEQQEISNLREALNVKNDLLEKQKKRLDILKHEVDEKGREQLETKCILERIQAEFLEGQNSSAFTEKFESAQSDLQMSYEKLKEELDLQQVELQNLKKELDNQSELLDQERKQLKQWVEHQRDHLTEWENLLITRANENRHLEADWKERSQKWSREKLEAESIIRGLLKQIEDYEQDEWNDDSNGIENQAA